MYVDAAILELGRAAGCIAYRPDVIIDHQHPLAGKTAWDGSYRETNAPAQYQADQAAFEAWRTSGLADDTATLIALAADAATVTGRERFIPQSAAERGRSSAILAETAKRLGQG
jgi:hypothetical protein